MSLTIVAGVVVGNSLTLDSLTTTDSHDTISVYTGLEGDDMARPQRCRKICAEPMFDRFIPEGQENIDNIILTVDEYEVIRLVDHESCTHEEYAKHMDIARSTVTEIYVSARKKIADSLINGKRLLIQGGHYRLCDGSSLGCRSEHCGKRRCSL